MKLLPSQVVEAMRGMFPGIGDRCPKSLNYSNLHKATQLLALLEAIPDELIVGSTLEVGAVITGRAGLQGWIQTCRARGASVDELKGDLIAMLFDVLQMMPDRVVPVETSALAFIDDQPLRLSILSDVASVETAMRDADWKAATVMAGSAAEALLLWAILARQRTTPATRSSAPSRSRRCRGGRRHPPSAGT